MVCGCNNSIKLANDLLNFYGIKHDYILVSESTNNNAFVIVYEITKNYIIFKKTIQMCRIFTREEINLYHRESLRRRKENL